MLDRRLFCLGSAAAIAMPRAATAAASTAKAGSADAAFARTLDGFYRTALDESPMLVTSLGIDTGARAAAKGKLDDSSPAGVARRKRVVADQLAQLKRIDRTRLGAAAAINYDAVLYDATLTDAADRQFAYGGVGAGSPYVLSQLNGAYASVPDFLDSQHVIATKADCEAYLARLDALAVAMDQEVERARHDVALGVVPPDFAIDGALAQMKVLRQPAATSTLVTSLANRARDKGIAGDWQARAGAVYDKRVVPALDRQMALLASLRPKAVHDAGVWRLPDGEAYYAASLRAATTTDLPPEEVHRLGLDVTRELSARADTLFRKLGMTKGTVAQRYEALFKDPRYLYPNTDAGKAKEIADLNALVQAMQKRLPSYFATLPRTPLEIRRIPAATEAGASTHYTEGSLDGTRPGIYWLNLRDTAEAPFWDMPTTTFHEGIPGHHLQITLQRESALPDYRKILFFGAYVEGWALYAEQLADEMGFYADQPAWELGYIHDALLRSGRLVVDTGIHAKRWSREQAVTTLSGIDGDPISLSGQEIERYAVSPGQACSYMVGKVTILRLREKAKAALGPRFDIGRFHDAVLLSGALPLAVLETRVDAFIVAGGRA
ncbi:Uncharacterized conserved protein, DUF885 familyt [Sphingomonas gellani]|uniref:Uncharacterized conserved protein, DUF885 familyt n=1 Tax=Sphingomonas gellani TaxID=1166340 RepID=A0A1H8DCA2_9SPHN|nr:DUF885 family protein [Sphingomonas gellani]SEN04198.1 Uncharacterized conserved protein, DUF885 familyt [Sphingomonas gellani]